MIRLLLLSTSFIIACWAAEPLQVTQEQLAELIDQRARPVLAAEQRQAVGQAASRVERSFLRPQVTGIASWEQGRIDSTDLDHRLAGISAQQHVFGFGTRAAANRVARHQDAALSHERALVSREVCRQARGLLAYWQHLSGQAVVLNHQHAHLEQQVDIANRRWRAAGRDSQRDILQLQAQQLQADNRRQSLIVGIADTRDRLADLLDCAADELAIEEHERPTNTAELLELITVDTSRPAADRLAALQAVSQARSDLATRQRLPQFSVGARAFVHDDKQGGQTDEYAVGLQMIWAYPGGSRRAEAELHRRQIVAFEHERQHILHDRQSAAERLQRTLQSLSERIDAQDQAISTAQRAYELTLAQYGNDQASLAAVDSSHTSVITSQMTRLELIAQEWTAWIELAALVGR